ncbi:MAG: Oxidoreductase, short-chain dehydrogenase/reductase family, partial [uncultured Friedmanniella sp.]
EPRRRPDHRRQRRARRGDGPPVRRPGLRPRPVRPAHRAAGRPGRRDHRAHRPPGRDRSTRRHRRRRRPRGVRPVRRGVRVDRPGGRQRRHRQGRRPGHRPGRREPGHGHDQLRRRPGPDRGGAGDLPAPAARPPRADLLHVGPARHAQGDDHLRRDQGRRRRARRGPALRAHPRRRRVGDLPRLHPVGDERARRAEGALHGRHPDRRAQHGRGHREAPSQGLRPRLAVGADRRAHDGAAPVGRPEADV